MSQAPIEQQKKPFELPLGNMKLIVSPEAEQMFLAAVMYQVYKTDHSAINEKNYYEVMKIAFGRGITDKQEIFNLFWNMYREDFVRKYAPGSLNNYLNGDEKQRSIVFGATCVAHKGNPDDGKSAAIETFDDIEKEIYENFNPQNLSYLLVDFHSRDITFDCYNVDDKYDKLLRQYDGLSRPKNSEVFEGMEVCVLDILGKYFPLFNTGYFDDQRLDVEFVAKELSELLHTLNTMVTEYSELKLLRDLVAECLKLVPDLVLKEMHTAYLPIAQRTVDPQGLLNEFLPQLQDMLMQQLQNMLNIPNEQTPSPNERLSVLDKAKAAQTKAKEQTVIPRERTGPNIEPLPDFNFG